MLMFSPFKYILDNVKLWGLLPCKLIITLSSYWSSSFLIHLNAYSISAYGLFSSPVWLSCIAISELTYSSYSKPEIIWVTIKILNKVYIFSFIWNTILANNDQYLEYRYWYDRHDSDPYPNQPAPRRRPRLIRNAVSTLVNTCMYQCIPWSLVKF